MAARCGSSSPSRLTSGSTDRDGSSPGGREPRTFRDRLLDARPADPFEENARDSAGRRLLVAREESAQLLLRPRGLRKGPQPLEDGEDARGVPGGQARALARQDQGAGDPPRDCLTVAQLAISAGRLECVSERVAEVQEPAVPRLAEIRRDDRGLYLHRSRDDLEKSPLVAGQDRIEKFLESLRKAGVPDPRGFGSLHEAAPVVAVRERRRRRRIHENRAWRVKSLDWALAERVIHTGLSS